MTRNNLKWILIFKWTYCRTSSIILKSLLYFSISDFYAWLHQLQLKFCCSQNWNSFFSSSLNVIGFVWVLLNFFSFYFEARMLNFAANPFACSCRVSICEWELIHPMAQTVTTRKKHFKNPMTISNETEGQLSLKKLSS